MIKQKSEVLAKFREFVNVVKNWAGLKAKQMNLKNQTVKFLRSDNSSEYLSNDFEDFHNNRGIQHEPTIPHSPQQNEIAECMKQSFVETTRSMLHHAQKLLKLWAEAVSTACYIQSRNPTTFLKNVTPYEHWYGKKRDISNLKSFGYKAYVHVLDAKRKGKFDRKSVSYVFPKYPGNYNWFKYYNPQTKQMLQSRDVIFMEDKFDVEKPDCTQENF